MKTLATLIVLIITLTANAQIESDLKMPKSDYSFGAIAGTSQGLGLAVRYWPSNFGVQVSFLPYYTEYTELLSVGVSGLMKIREYKDADFYISAGAHTLRNDYRNQLILGIEPSVNLYSKDGNFSIFGSFGYNYAKFPNSFSITPGGAIGFFINL
ncbi:MAG: hypothetical protein ACPGLV_03100 [Bacteroidia bacterium]